MLVYVMHIYEVVWENIFLVWNFSKDFKDENVQGFLEKNIYLTLLNFPSTVSFQKPFLHIVSAS